MRTDGTVEYKHKWKYDSVGNRLTWDKGDGVVIRYGFNDAEYRYDAPSRILRLDRTYGKR